MSFFEKLFAQRDAEKRQVKDSGLKETMREKTQMAVNKDLSVDERRAAFKEAKEAKAEKLNIESEGTEMLKQKIREQNQALRDKLAAQDEAKLAETRKAFEEGVDITDDVEADMNDVEKAA